MLYRTWRAVLRITLVVSALLVPQAVCRAQFSASLTGVVRDVTGAPLADVSVSLLGETTVTRSDTAGRFTLRDIAPGGHTTLFRRLGYRSVEYRWTARANAGLEIAVAMTPLPQQLGRVVVEASGASRRRGTSSIAGSVTDSAGRPVSGADVRLLGSGLSTVTDSSGQFDFRQLAAGSYIVRARRRGLLSGTYVMQIGEDDNRGITLKQFDLPLATHDTSSASGYGAPDAGFDAFDRRQRAGAARPTLGPGDLFRADRAHLDILLQQYRDSEWAHRRPSLTSGEGKGSTDEGDCLVIDGRRAAYQPLRTFSSVDVQLVEVFRANASVDDYVVSRMEMFKECRGTMERHPSYFVLWTRSLR